MKEFFVLFLNGLLVVLKFLYDHTTFSKDEKGNFELKFAVKKFELVVRYNKTKE